ncbi:MAG: hypothetical protein H0W55_15655 [Actinobacteria bacterium]|nr:hypothetical protein [Actinomycetota bacterium]MDQ3533099.1 hypothetical protein [Actinomycetota bacterium]
MGIRVERRPLRFDLESDRAAVTTKIAKTPRRRSGLVLVMSMQPTVRDVDAALEALRSEDPKAAQNADAGLQALTGGEGFDGVTQHSLQYFLW